MGVDSLFLRHLHTYRIADADLCRDIEADINGPLAIAKGHVPFVPHAPGSMSQLRASGDDKGDALHLAGQPDLQGRIGVGQVGDFAIAFKLAVAAPRSPNQVKRAYVPLPLDRIRLMDREFLQLGPCSFCDH